MSSQDSLSKRHIDKSFYGDVNDVLQYGIGPQADQRFSSVSKADIYEVRDGKATVYPDLNDDQLLASIKADLAVQGSRIRIYFVDAVLEDADRLHITPTIFRSLTNSYSITKRFTDLLWWQHMPSRAVHHDSRTQQPIEHELWYSVVCRYMTFGPGGRDPSRRVLGWQRMCVWSNFELADSSTTFVIFRCKEEIKQKFLNHFTGDGGARLWDHPMLAHAFMLQHKTMQTTAFQHEFADPLYLLEEEGEAVRSVHEHTRRAKNFLALSRRLEQITTDFDILESSINLVKREVKTYERDFCDQPGVAITSKGTSGNGIALLACPPRNVSTLLDDTLGSLIDDIGLARSYNRVYRERARIGINECFAVVNQLDAEQNNHTARESAAIALASRSDNLSLRTIQYMSMLFLPASLASSIFGMGFFTTDVDDNGNSHFFVSTKWWMWVLISVVLTLVCFAIVFWGASWNAERKRISDEDTKEV